MADFWEEFRNKVLTGTTAADISTRIYEKVVSTGVVGPAVVKPAYYLGHMSIITMDFMNNVERLLENADGNHRAMLRSMSFLRETCRTMKYDINHAADPMERLITMMEDILESEELAAMEDGDEEDTSPETAAANVDADLTEAQDEEDIEREALSPQRESLEESLRVKLRQGDFSEHTVNELALTIGAIYLECVQFARELARLAKAPDEDTSTIMSILMDLQYGLDTQLRGQLMDDVDISDLEPTYRLGFFVWSAHFVSEVMEKLHAERAPATLVTP